LLILNFWLLPPWTDAEGQRGISTRRATARGAGLLRKLRTAIAQNQSLSMYCRENGERCLGRIAGLILAVNKDLHY